MAEVAEAVVTATGLPAPPRDCGGREPPAYECDDYRPFLGLRSDFVLDRQLSWLAQEALCAPLPSDWSEHLDPEFGMVYFRQLLGKGRKASADNARVSWRHPVDDHFHELVPHVTALGARIERLVRPGKGPARGESRRHVAPEVTGELPLGKQTFVGEIEPEAERRILAYQLATAWRHHAELLGGLAQNESSRQRAAPHRRPGRRSHR